MPNDLDASIQLLARDALANCFVDDAARARLSSRIEEAIEDFFLDEEPRREVRDDR